jgi:hypothetical protein
VEIVMAVTNQTVTELYIATFNRAPDAVGLNYWVNNAFTSETRTIERIAQSFFDQSETQAIYTPSMQIVEKVTLAYQNLFNREPDAAGLQYWVYEITNQRISQSDMLIALINGAHSPTGSAADAMILDNKTTVGLYYVDANLNDVETATSVMLGITSQAETIAVATAEIDYIVNNFIFLDPLYDTGISNSDKIINLYNSVKVSLKLAHPDSEVQFFNDINNNDQQDAGEYVNSVSFSRTTTDYTALLDFVSQTTTDGSPLSDGEHQIKAMQLVRSASGEQSVLSVSLPLVITLDTTAPVIENLNIAQNEGSAVSEELFTSNGFSFTFSGTTEANSLVVQYDELGNIFGQATSDAQGNFVFTTLNVDSQLHGHTYKFSFRATDIAGNSPDQNEVPVWVTVDKDQSGSLLMWYDNAYEYVDMTYIKHSKIGIGLTMGELSAYTISYSMNGGSQWSEITTQTASFNISAGSYSAGQIQVKLVDAAGNSSGTTFNANNIVISSTFDLNTTMLMGYTPPNSVGVDTNTVTPNLGSDSILNNGDTFSFYDDINQILSIVQVGEVIRFNDASLRPVNPAPTSALVADGQYYVLRGIYNEEFETFSVNDTYLGDGLASLIVFDGDSSLAVKQQGVILIGISPAHMQLGIGEINIY